MAAVQKSPERFYPVHPSEHPVDPSRLNQHQRLFVDGIADTQSAVQALAQKMIFGTVAVTVPGNSGTSFFVNIPLQSDTNYMAFASVEGGFLQVGDVERGKNQVRVFVRNLDSGQRSGTVMVFAFRPS